MNLPSLKNHKRKYMYIHRTHYWLYNNSALVNTIQTSHFINSGIHSIMPQGRCILAPPIESGLASLVVPSQTLSTHKYIIFIIIHIQFIYIALIIYTFISGFLFVMYIDSYFFSHPNKILPLFPHIKTTSWV